MDGTVLIFLILLWMSAASGRALVLFFRRQRAAGATHSWARLLAGNLLVFVFLLSLLIDAGELYYRYIFDQSDAINYTLVSRRWFDRYWVRNGSGFRDDVPYSMSATPGMRRVSFVGDSFAAGHGIANVDNRFANLIRAAHPGWEIHVLAKTGLDTGDEIKLLKEMGDDGYQCDQVVLVYCMNDLGDMMPGWMEAAAQFYNEAQKPNWLLRNSYLVNTLHYHFKASQNPYLKNYCGFVEEAYRGALWERQKARLTEFRDLVKSLGGRLAVVTFPFMQDTGPGYSLRFAHQELGEFWDGLGVPNLDLLDAYSSYPPGKLMVNRYDAHPNEFAHQIAAREVEKFLKTQLDASASPAPRPKP